MNLEQIRRILEQCNIPYESGRRTLDLNCPYCLGRRSGKPDDQHRLGIFGSGRYYCLRCKRVGHLSHLLRDLAGVSWEQYKGLIGGKIKDDPRTLSEMITDTFAGPSRNDPESGEIELPATAWEVSAKVVARYPELAAFLRRRNISRRTAEAYLAWYNPTDFRLGWPVWGNDGRLVAWQGRDVTGKAKKKYFSQGQLAGCVYWSRWLTPGRVYIVEGVLDCWRMESNAAATFTCDISLRQQKELVLSTPLVEEVVFAWDGEMYERSKNAARQISPLVKAGAIRLPKGEDPDKLGEEFVKGQEVWWV